MNTQVPQAAAEQEAAPATLAGRIEAQRRQVFKVMSIVEACRMGSDSMLAPMHSDEDENGEPDFEGALAAAHDLLNDIASELEGMGRSPAKDTETNT